MTRSKGTNILNIREFVVQRMGQAAWDQLVAAMPEPDRATLTTVLAFGWYDFGLNARLLAQMVATLGQKDRALARQYGAFEAERDLTGVHRLFLRLANPAYVLEKAGEYWFRFYDTGTWTIQRHDGNHASGTLKGMDGTDEDYCAYLTAYVTRMFELVGAKEVRVTHPVCSARGGPHCVYDIHWA